MGGPSRNYVGPSLGPGKTPKHGYARKAGGPSQRYPEYKAPKQYMSPYGPPGGGGGLNEGPYGPPGGGGGLKNGPYGPPAGGSGLNDGPWQPPQQPPQLQPQLHAPPPQPTLDAPSAVAVPREPEEVPDVEATVKALEESVRLLIDGQADDVLQVQEQISAVGREVRAISAEVRSLTGAQAETQQKMDDLRQLLATTLEELQAAREADEDADDNDDDDDDSEGGRRRRRRSDTAGSESPRRGGSQEKPAPSDASGASTVISCDTASADLAESTPLPLASATAGNTAGEDQAST